MVLEGEAEKFKCINKDDLSIMMKNSLSISGVMKTVLLAPFLVLIFAGCSSRLDPVVNNEFGSVLYSPKDSSDLDAGILLYKGTDKAGRFLVTDTFTIGEKSRVFASINILNRIHHRGEDIMVHIDWLDPYGNSFFKKREDLTADDTVSVLSSAISIPSDRRETGNYKFRVYLFRELAAEKSFFLVNYNADSAAVFPQKSFHPVSANIVLRGIRNHNDGAMNDSGTVFEIKNKSKLYAEIRLNNKDSYPGKEFAGEIAWSMEDDKPFYTKRFSISSFDTAAELNSAISTGIRLREPGDYSLKVFLYNRLIGERIFKLIPQKKEELKLQQLEGIQASIIFCSKVGKKTKKPLRISDRFTIKEKGSVYAVIPIKFMGIKPINSAIKVEWISPENEPFYSKKFKFKQTSISDTLSNSISVSKKRKPGIYKCRVYFNKVLIAEKPFTLNSP